MNRVHSLDSEQFLNHAVKHNETMKKLIITNLLIASALSSQAVVVALYDGVDSGNTNFETSEAPAATNFGSTYTANVGGISTSNENAFVTTIDAPSTLADSITGGDYHSFIIGSAVNNLTGVSIDLSYWFNNGFAGGSYSVNVMNSTDGFVAGNQDGTLTITDLNNGTDATALTGSFALPDVVAGDSLEVRLYFSDSSTSTTRFHRLDAATVNATVTPVPEPSSAALLGLGALALILRRRRG